MLPVVDSVCFRLGRIRVISRALRPLCPWPAVLSESARVALSAVSVLSGRPLGAELAGSDSNSPVRAALANALDGPASEAAFE